MKKSMIALAGLAALGVGSGPSLQYPYYNVGETDDGPMPPTAAQTARWRDQRGYPQTGTGKRQGERVARLVSRSPAAFAASDKCIARILKRTAP